MEGGAAVGAVPRPRGGTRAYAGRVGPTGRAATGARAELGADSKPLDEVGVADVERPNAARRHDSRGPDRDSSVALKTRPV